MDLPGMLGAGVFGMGVEMNATCRTLGVIPARGGSKGIPGKNIRLLAGKPLIAYTIEAARESQLLTRFVVSTDDKEIAAVAKAWGAPVLMRPSELAADDTPMAPVVQHVLSTLRSTEGDYDYIVLLQPTAPLRTGNDIDGALSLLQASSADSVISLYQVEQGHPYYMYTVENDQPKPLMIVPPGVTRRQQFPAIYVRNGAIYAVKRDILLEQHSFFGARTQAYIMPFLRSINIDTETDLLFAEFLLTRIAAPQGS
ncbi:MAG: acylneuraminate cytidylyltransferase family protein [Ardenticatenaceae bacterium]|nr:acylneuraminate cytidylyltransferase family protein [Ardenticatenaceae bacterium]